MPAAHSTFSIIGASGFIGTALAEWLYSQDQVVHAVTRASLPAFLATRRPVGHVIDCAGLTGALCGPALDAAEAHVGLVAHCLADLRFDSFLLLSSTLVYARASVTQEDALLATQPTDPADLFSATKLAGEALCLTDPRATVRVVRLSNVYGIRMSAGTFLGQVLREAGTTGTVLFGETAESAQDYVSIAAVARLLPAIAAAGQDRIYNVAAGSNTSHAAIADRLRDIAGWRVIFAPDAPTVRRLAIDTTRLVAEFGPATSDILVDLPNLLALAQEAKCSPSMRLMAA